MKTMPSKATFYDISETILNAYSKDNTLEISDRLVALLVLKHRVQFDIYAWARIKNKKSTIPKGHSYKKLPSLRKLEELMAQINEAIDQSTSVMDIQDVFKNNKFINEYTKILKVPKLIDYKMARKSLTK